MNATDATVVVVTWNGAHLLPACLDAVLPEGAPVLVVDNASTDGTVAMLAERYPTVRVLASPVNAGFAGGVARAFDHVSTPVVVLLNNDAVVRPGWLAALLRGFADPAVAAVTSRLLLPDGRVNSAGGVLTRNGYGHDIGFGLPDGPAYDTAGEVAYGCGAALALRADAVREVGGVDSRFFLYYEDVDLCWRLRLAGHRVVYAPDAVVDHEHSATAGEFSLLHTYQTERNRLATLVTCATVPLALRMLARFPLTTVSVAAYESRAKAWQRVRAYVSVLGWLPALLRRRRRVVVRVPRAEVQARWLTAPPD
ncbi:MAG TPA: glycosyltransferase family 2 protein [Mycobacteriales bacterium]